MIPALQPCNLARNLKGFAENVHNQPEPFRWSLVTDDFESKVNNRNQCGREFVAVELFNLDSFLICRRVAVWIPTQEHLPLLDDCSPTHFDEHLEATGFFASQHCLCKARNPLAASKEKLWDRGARYRLREGFRAQIPF